MKKNIWIFNHYAGPPSLVHATRHYNFAKYLIKQGYSVTVFAASTIHGSSINLIKSKSSFIFESREGVPFVFIKTNKYKNNKILRILNMLGYYFGLLRVTKEFEKPEVIIGSSVHPLACVAAIQIAKRYDCECIIEIRDLWPESLVVYNGFSPNSIVVRLLYRLERWIYEQADKIIFTIPGGSKYIQKHGWDLANGGTIGMGQVYHLNNGVDLLEFLNNQRINQLQDEDLDNPTTYKIVYTGSISRVNCIGRLIEAAVIVKENGLSAIRFIIYGDGTERIELEEYIKTKHIDNVVFKGPVNKHLIPYILSKCNAAFNEGMNSSIFQFGSSANKQFDYYAAGLPVISAIRCWDDIIEKYKCGFVIKDDTPQSLADVICSCYRLSQEEYALMRKNAYQASIDYDIQILTGRLIDIIEAFRTRKQTVTK